MNNLDLINQIKKKKSFLCVGLDTDLKLIPPHLLDTEDPMFEFNKQIIDATSDLAVAYKPNVAFYEAEGTKGWISLEKTVHYIKSKYPKIFVIADAKRGDIGNTSNMYAKAFLENLPFDAVTVAPYMGKDSVTPFLEYPGKWAIILALTSNNGAFDFQMQHISGKSLDHPPFLYEEVLSTAKDWGTKENTMFVVGATQASSLQKIRQIVPEHFLLIPAVGKQGGSMEEVIKFGMTKDCGLLVNLSRNIIYASNDKNFAQAAAEVARTYQQIMEKSLYDYKII